MMKKILTKLFDKLYENDKKLIEAHLPIVM